MKVIEGIEQIEFNDYKQLDYSVHHYFCPTCEEEIGKVYKDKKEKLFYEWTIMKDDVCPNFCPFCGTELEFVEKENG